MGNTGGSVSQGNISVSELLEVPMEVVESWNSNNSVYGLSVRVGTDGRTIGQFKKFARSVYTRRTAHAQWEKGNQESQEPFSATKGLERIDPNGDMEYSLVPTVRFTGRTDATYSGKSELWTAEGELIGTVSSGKDMTVEKFLEMNDYPLSFLEEEPTWFDLRKPEFVFHNSDGYEVLTPSDIARIMDRNVYPYLPEGFDTMGFLGNGGKDGLWIAGQLSEFRSEIQDKLGTNGKQFIGVHSDPNGSVSLWIGTRIVVCWNTLTMALSEADSHLYTTHHSGVRERFDQMTLDMVETARQAHEAVENNLAFLNTIMINPETVRELTETIFPLPKKPNPSRRAKSTMEERLEAWEYRAEAVMADRKMVETLILEPKYSEFAGITDRMRTSAGDPTAMAALQGVSVFTSNAKMRNPDGVIKDQLSGWRKSVVDDTFGFFGIDHQN